MPEGRAIQHMTFTFKEFDVKDVDQVLIGVRKSSIEGTAYETTLDSNETSIRNVGSGELEYVTLYALGQSTQNGFVAKIEEIAEVHLFFQR